MSGREMDGAELVRKIARYQPYFGKDGGVTFSGGEPLLQAEFLASMIPLLQAEGIRYIVDTSGAVPLTESVKAVLRDAQGVLLDLKFWDAESYLHYTGRENGFPLQILRYLNEIGKRTRIRIVVIPGINDREEIMDRYLVHLRDLDCVTQIELLPFHTMGFFKYEELGIENPLANTPPLDADRKKELQEYVHKKFGK